LPRLAPKYIETGVVQFAFRHFPLPSHRLALEAARTGECAAEQGDFWRMHDFLFREQSGMSTEFLRSAPQTLGLESELFEKCMSSTGPQRVKADLQQGKTIGVSGTPTFLGGLRQEDKLRVIERLKGVQSYDQFDEFIDRLLHRAL